MAAALFTAVATRMPVRPEPEPAPQPPLARTKTLTAVAMPRGTARLPTHRPTRPGPTEWRALSPMCRGAPHAGHASGNLGSFCDDDMLWKWFGRSNRSGAALREQERPSAPTAGWTAASVPGPPGPKMPGSGKVTKDHRGSSPRSPCGDRSVVRRHPDLDELRRLPGENADAHLVDDQELAQRRAVLMRVELSTTPLQLDPPAGMDLPKPSLRLGVVRPELAEIAFVEDAEPDGVAGHDVRKGEAWALDVDHQIAAVETQGSDGLAGVALRRRHDRAARASGMGHGQQV